jgi:hypothetical protein
MRPDCPPDSGAQAERLISTAVPGFVVSEAAAASG